MTHFTNDPDPLEHGKDDSGFTPRIESDRTTKSGKREVTAIFAFTPYRTYRVELEVWTELGELLNDCRIYLVADKFAKSASLAMLQDVGYLEDAQGRTHEVEQAHIDDIAAWAGKEGY